MTNPRSLEGAQRVCFPRSANQRAGARVESSSPPSDTSSCPTAPCFWAGEIGTRFRPQAWAGVRRFVAFGLAPPPAVGWASSQLTVILSAWGVSEARVLVAGS
jgi:hypothetical protein